MFHVKNTPTNSESENALHRFHTEKWWVGLRQFAETREIVISQIGLSFN